MAINKQFTIIDFTSCEAPVMGAELRGSGR